MTGFICGFLLLIWLVGTTPSSGPVSPFSREWFNGLSATEKLAVVSAALASREAELQNFAYELTEEVKNIDKKTAREEPLWTRHTRTKRKGIRILLHDEEWDDGKKQFEFFMNWDGSRSRTLNLPNHEHGLDGVIEDVEPTNFAVVRYNVLLGLRVWKLPLTLPQWLEQSSREGRLQGISAVEKDGRTLIEIHVKPEPVMSERYWLDPSLGYMPVRYEIRSEDKKGPVNWGVQWVEDAKLLDGLWIPVRVVSHETCRGCEATSQLTSVVSKFDRGTVTDSDVSIEFPPGTIVVDRVERVAFKVLEGGGRQLRELYDPATGLVTIGGETVEEVFAQAQNPFRGARRAWLRPAISVAIMVLAAGAAVVVLVRRRRVVKG